MIHGSLDAPAAILRRMVDELRVDAAILYVPSRGNRMLTAALTVGSPISIFVAQENVPVASAGHTSSQAYREGRQVFETARIALTSGMPFPYTVISTPLRTEAENVLGTLTGIWTPPLEPAGFSGVRSGCTRFADALARSLALPAADGPADTPENHYFLSASDPSRPIDVTFLRNIYGLATDLVPATKTRDVVMVAAERLMTAFRADAMAVCVDENGRLRVVGYSGYPADLMDLGARAPAGGPSEEAGALRHEVPVFLESEAELAKVPIGVFSGGRKACALLPLAGTGRRGVLVLAFDRARGFRAEERAALVTMTDLVSQALERASLFDVEHVMAQKFQQGLLPHTLPHLERLDTSARYVSASEDGEVGGDWYDVLALADGNVALIVGDVEGHSSSAAAVMGQIRSGVRAYAEEGHGPADLLGRVNQLLNGLEPGRLATCCCVWMDLGTGVAEIASAGHPPPLVRQPDGAVAAPEVEVGLPLGVEPDAVYGSADIGIPPGGVLALYTDGLVRSRTLDIGTGTARLRAVMAEAGGRRLEDLADRLLAVADDTVRRDDDAALLLVRYEGHRQESAPRVSRLYVQRHDLQGVRETRRFIHGLLSHWGLLAISYETELIATELATNALLHADSDVDVRLRKYPGRIRVDIRDSSTRPPVPAPIVLEPETDRFSEHGRGLVIVAELASAWGNSPVGRGKSVWFEMATPEEVI